MDIYQHKLALKKQRLLYRCDEQRRELKRNSASLVAAFSIAETLSGGVRWARGHPLLIAGLMATVVVAKPRRALRWVRRAWLAWLTLRRLIPEKKPATASVQPD